MNSRTVPLLAATILVYFLSTQCSQAQQPDTVRVGMYITNMYDLNMAENSYHVDFWLWYLYRNPELTPLETSEICNAIEYEFMLPDIEEVDGIQWATQKCRAGMIHTWDIVDFPFDCQVLEIRMEDANLDTESLTMIADTANTALDPDIVLDGWDIVGLQLVRTEKTYRTTYGNPELSGVSVYPGVTLKLTIRRQGWGTFFKVFTGLYVGFMIALLVFFISAEDGDRFGLSVAGLFAAVGNKYIVDSFLPSTVMATLTDKIHNMTFLLLLLSILLSVVTLRIRRKGRSEQLAMRLDVAFFVLLLLGYIVLNYVMVSNALAP
ncbi:MAG: hypothetical protein RBU27_11000 [Bacteroidota bacterium]|nr:hypothetical protein [Bacteroidota bacterium]